MVLLGTFNKYVVCHETSVVKIDPSIPLDLAALCGCGVVTGWGSAVYAAKVEPGDTVVVIGIGGVGANAVQGAKLAGAKRIFAIDPVEFKRKEALRFGATDVAGDPFEASGPLALSTNGQMADKVIITTSVATGDLIAPAMALVSKGGRLVVTSAAPMFQMDVQLNLFDLTMLQKNIQGAIFGGANPRADIPKLLGLFQSGQLLLDELITKRYTLDQINEGYDDMLNGRLTRGVIIYD
jgi:S-(hydroxymethyl)glutathione dehydrogenase/alcohol dehydrogenase